MIEAIFYVISFLGALGAIVMYPKTEKKINVIMNVMFSYVTLLCIGALSAFCMSVMRIAITPYSMSIVFGVVAIIALGMMIRKRTIQCMEVRKIDIIAVMICVGVVGIVSLKIFTPYVKINYVNPVDSGNHYLYAMNVIRNEEISSMFFNPLYNAMFMRIFTWILPEEWTYKAFILSDIYHVIIELVFFYAVLVELTKTKKYKWRVLGVSIVYWFGYSLFAMLDAYIYWSMAVMLVQYVIIILKWYMEFPKKRKVLLAYAAIGCISVALCYIQLAPGVFIATLAVMVYCLACEKKIQITKRLIIGGIIVAVFTMLCAIAGYYLVFASRNLKLSYALSLGTMSIKGLEILILLPIVVVPMWEKYQNKMKWHAIEIAFICHMCLQVIFTVITAIGVMSDYYLSKNYFVIWALCIMLIMYEKDFWVGQARKYLKGYIVALVCFLTISYDSEEAGALSLKHSIYISNADHFVDGNFSEGYMSDHDNIYLFKYAMREIETEYPVPLLVSNERKGAGGWYRGLYENATYYTKPSWTQEEIENVLNQTQAEYFIVLFSDPLYNFQLRDYFDTFERVYVNEKGFVAKR